MSNIGILSQHSNGLRWMRFVDGENLTIEGIKCLKNNNIDLMKLSKEKFYEKDAIWIPSQLGWWQGNICFGDFLESSTIIEKHYQQRLAIRSYYYIAKIEADSAILKIEENLQALGFSPQVFRKIKGLSPKGVDIGLATTMLDGAHKNNFDLVELWAGDADYIPLVKKVQEMGKIVICCFFKEFGLSQKLKVQCDQFFDISNFFTKQWEKSISEREKEKTLKV